MCDFTLENVISILQSGVFDDLIGVVENEWFECKKEPYHLNTATNKQELAKDVAGLANAHGGLILLGVKTAKQPIHLWDQVSEISPLDHGLVNIEQYYSVLHNWIYPSLTDVTIKWFPSRDDENRGIIAIHVPEQPEALQPFLLVRTIDENDKVVEKVFGLFERHRANVNHTTVQRLHSIIRDGLRFHELSQQIDSLQDMLQRFLDASQSPFQAVDTGKILDERIDRALAASDLQNKPAFVLAVLPLQPTTIPTLFAGRDSELVRLLDSPPSLRWGGFNIDAGRTKNVSGQLRRAVEPGYKLIELWRDGTLIFAASGDSDFLSWGKDQSNNDPLIVNPAALIESTYLFVDLSKNVLTHANPIPSWLLYCLEIRNMSVADKPCRLRRNFSKWTSSLSDNAPNSGNRFLVKWDKQEIDSERIAFLLVSQVYEWFGGEHNDIPLTETIDSYLIISPEKIRTLTG
jgi:hypothetical protein